MKNNFYTRSEGSITTNLELTDIVEFDITTEPKLTKTLMYYIRTGENPLYNNKELMHKKIIFK